MLRIDSRERPVAEQFRKVADVVPFDIKFKMITTGDYAYIDDDTIQIIIERKTWSDLAKSFSDGRKPNLKKLLDLRTKTGCKIFYIIEGKRTFPSGTIIAGKRFEDLQAHLDHLMFERQIHVVQTADHAHSALRIIQLIKNSRRSYARDDVPEIPEVSQEYDKGGAPGIPMVEREHDRNSADGGEPSDLKSTGAGESQPNRPTAEELLTAKHSKTDAEIRLQLLSAIPGVGECTAQALMDAGITIRSLIMGEAKVHDVQYASGRYIGSALGRKICMQFSEREIQRTWYRLLLRVPGIGPKTAKLITAKFSDPYYMIRDWRIGDITGMLKHNGRNIENAIVKFVLCLE